MAGIDIPPGLGPQGQSTIATTSPSSTASTSQKVLTPEGLQAVIDTLQAQKDELNALVSPGRSPTLPTEEETAAQIASQEQSAAATPKSTEPPAPQPAKSPDAAYQDEISQALKGNPAPFVDPFAPPPSMADRESPRFTSQQLNATPEMRAPQTLAAAQDEAVADKARQQAKAAQAFQAEQARIEAQKQQDMQAAYQEIQQLAADKAKNTHLTTMWEDMSTPRKILTGIAVGLGTWLGAGMGAPTAAIQMLNREMDRDLEIKKLKVQQYLQRMQVAGARPEQIRQMSEDAQKHLLATQQAQLNTIEAQANQLLAPFPQAQQKLQIALAQKKAEIAKDQRDFAAQLAQTKSATAESGHTVETSMTGVRPGAGGDKAAQLGLGAAAGARTMDALRRLSPPTPEELEKAEKARRDYERQSKQETGEKGSVASVVNAAGRGADLESFPKTPRGNIAESSRKYLDLVDDAATSVITHTLGPRAAGNEDVWDRAKAALVPMPNDSAKRILEKREELGRRISDIQAAATGTPADMKIKQAAGMSGSQMAKAPRSEVLLYTKAKQAAHPTKAQEAAIKAFEATYGR